MVPEADYLSMSTHSGPPAKPLLLLDVDGVINDLSAVMKVRPLGDDAQEEEQDKLVIPAPDRAEGLGVDIVRSHGFWVAIPRDMPELIQDVTSQSETWWCSTWRSHANDEIARHLGVGPFPFVDDGNGGRGNGWKIDAARPIIERALADERPVVWIGDFHGRLPDIEGVTYIDTGDRGALRWSDIPDELLRPAA